MTDDAVLSSIIVFLRHIFQICRSEHLSPNADIRMSLPAPTGEVNKWVDLAVEEMMFYQENFLPGQQLVINFNRN